MFRALMRSGPEGESAGDLGRSLGVAPSTLSRHLALLEQAGLVTARRQARHIYYAIDLYGVRQLFGFLIDDCCRGAPEMCDLTDFHVKGEAV
jgi:DNA-binding transcriptional ArsR family regulator